MPTLCKGPKGWATREPKMCISCPYCNTRPPNSDDHVFPQFLGGSATVRTCKACNDRFGHTFEGSVSTDLAPIVIALRRAGLHSPKTIVWRRAFKDADGTEYDLDSNLGAQPSTPLIERDDKGDVQAALFHNEKMKRKFLAAAERKGKRTHVEDSPERTIHVPAIEFQLSVGLDLRRLATKMAVATARCLHDGLDVLDKEGRMYLLGDARASTRTQLAIDIYPSLENLRVPLAHLVYVEGSSRTRSCYGIVQLYGLVQMYVLLNDGSYSGHDFAVTGLLNPLQKYAETFRSVEPLDLPRPSSYYFAEAYAKTWETKFSTELTATLGEETTFRMEHAPPVRSKWVISSGTAQLTKWISHRGTR